MMAGEASCEASCKTSSLSVPVDTIEGLSGSRPTYIDRQLEEGLCCVVLTTGLAVGLPTCMHACLHAFMFWTSGPQEAPWQGTAYASRHNHVSLYAATAVSAVTAAVSLPLGHVTKQ
jgi:hypothetical protein